MALLDWIRVGEARGDRSHCRRRATDVDVWPQAKDGAAVGVQAAKRERLVCRLEYCDGLPECRRQPTTGTKVWICKSSRHHADNRRRHAVNWNRFAEQRAVAAVVTHEELVRDDGHIGCAEAFLIRAK